jgi:creatinine deaminase
LADRDSRIVARGHNLRVQSGDPTAHAETVCIRNAGRRRDWTELTLVSTLSPCIMCTGTALLYRIPRIIVGENRNFLGAEDLFRQHGVNLLVVNDPDCIQLMAEFVRLHPDLWNEDIGM